jgi:hypothetical protein
VPIVEPIPKPAWRVNRQRDIAKRLAGFHGRDSWPIERVKTLFREIVWDQLPTLIREHVRHGNRIEVQYLARDAREHLEDLYDALAERAQLGVLFLVWDELEKEMGGRRR